MVEERELLLSKVQKHSYLYESSQGDHRDNCDEQLPAATWQRGGMTEKKMLYTV